jgi:hypothetical protein
VRAKTVGYISNLPDPAAYGPPLHVYRKDSLLHREDGPAVEYSNGSKCWYLNGLRHREDGKPAIEYFDGYKAWLVHGKRHRIEGPARIWPEETKQIPEWWLHGKQMDAKIHKILTDGSNEELLLLMGQEYDDLIELRLKGEL